MISNIQGYRRIPLFIRARMGAIGCISLVDRAGVRVDRDGGGVGLDDSPKNHSHSKVNQI